MTEAETRTRESVRSMAGNNPLFIGYLRGLLSGDTHDERVVGAQLVVWALDEQRIMLYAGEWK